jgi:hypothetical protein
MKPRSNWYWPFVGFGLMIIVCLSLVAVTDELAAWNRTRVRLANLDRIKIGMSEEEVIQILGQPDGPTHGGNIVYPGWWDSEDGFIEVNFHVSEGVTSKTFQKHPTRAEKFLKRCSEAWELLREAF